jgi:hypothetical protein
MLRPSHTYRSPCCGIASLPQLSSECVRRPVVSASTESYGEHLRPQHQRS